MTGYHCPYCKGPVTLITGYTERGELRTAECVCRKCKERSPEIDAPAAIQRECMLAWARKRRAELTEGYDEPETL